METLCVISHERTIARELEDWSKDLHIANCTVQLRTVCLYGAPKAGNSCYQFTQGTCKQTTIQMKMKPHAHFLAKRFMSRRTRKMGKIRSGLRKSMRYCMMNLIVQYNYTTDATNDAQ